MEIGIIIIFPFLSIVYEDIFRCLCCCESEELYTCTIDGRTDSTAPNCCCVFRVATLLQSGETSFPPKISCGPPHAGSI